jgi:hypothetical protein
VQSESPAPSLWSMDKGLPISTRNKTRRSKLRLKAQVLVPKDLPISQNEIEVIATLLDDWELTLPEAAE